LYGPAAVRKTRGRPAREGNWNGPGPRTRRRVAGLLQPERPGPHRRHPSGYRLLAAGPGW